ncbi:hypothetical protein [Streptomyces sp. WAC00263]|uniref:hypothetical protein n=1 Tax=Streptomyces sp. WAC00263 TaxID=1917422 RepID=UPI001F50F6DA|nr:hypothetical protein [Streptomyces sp. WAC00263]
MTGIDIRHYTSDQAAAVRPTMLEVYAEVYADAIAADPFKSVDRFAAGLDGWSSRTGWSCVVGYAGDQAVGYAYGAPLPENARWWGGLLTEVPEDVVRETGTRTYALSELTVRIPWRKTGAARRLHDELLAEQSEERQPSWSSRPIPRSGPCTSRGAGRSSATCARTSSTPRSSTPCCSTSPSTDCPLSPIDDYWGWVRVREYAGLPLQASGVDRAVPGGVPFIPALLCAMISLHMLLDPVRVEAECLPYVHRPHF